MSDAVKRYKLYNFGRYDGWGFLADAPDTVREECGNDSVEVVLATAYDAQVAENERVREALRAIEQKLAEYLERLLQGRTLPNRWVGEINDVVQEAKRLALAASNDKGDGT